MKLKSIFWKGYFIFASIFISSSIFGVLSQGIYRSLEVIDIVIFIGSLIGLFGFAWHKKIFTKYFWKIYFVMMIIWNIAYLSLTFLEASNKSYHGHIYMILTIILLAPLVYSIYKYKFVDKNEEVVDQVMSKTKKNIMIGGFLIVFLFATPVFFTSFLKQQVYNPRFLEILHKMEEEDPGSSVVNIYIDTALLPMYGEFRRSPEDMKADEKFIEDTLELGTREEGAVEMAAIAWELYKQGDSETAMRRFNQVWLLDSNSADAYYGFGVIYGNRGKHDLAIKYLEKALELNPEYVDVAHNLSQAYKDKAQQKHLTKEEKQEYLKKSIEYENYSGDKMNK